MLAKFLLSVRRSYRRYVCLRNIAPFCIIFAAAAFPATSLNIAWAGARATANSGTGSQEAQQAATPQKHPGAQTSELAGAVPGAKYVGADTCKTCHEELYIKHFEGTPHYALLKQQHGCEDCHGPGSAHVDGGGDPAKIIRIEKLSPAQTAAICTRCHQSSLETQNFSKSEHLANGVSCTSCHSPHKSKDVNFLLVKTQTELCFGCHAAQRAEFARPFRHRVDVGLIQCSDCHNPHGTEVGHQVRAAAGQFAICTKCHTDTMGPFVFEHAPVKSDERCLSCHTPHGSTNPRLLQVNNVNFLCLRCHTPNMNGAAGRPLGPVHDQAAKYQACTMCHTQIHGSNFDPFFFR